MLTDPVVRRYLGGPLDPGMVHAATSDTKPGTTWGSFVIELVGPDVVAGSCSVDRDRGELEVSYQLLPEFVGMGIATEALEALLAWAYRECPDEDHVIAVTQVANVPSRRLLERLGFTERERFVEYDAEQVLYSAPLAGFGLAGSGPTGSGPTGSGPAGSGPAGSGPAGSGPAGSGPA